MRIILGCTDRTLLMGLLEKGKLEVKTALQMFHFLNINYKLIRKVCLSFFVFDYYFNQRQNVVCSIVY